MKNEIPQFTRDSEIIGKSDNNIEKEESKEKREVIDWTKKVISLWHDQVSPDYIFLTESGAIPYGFLLKEAWKNAFPNEIPPIFYRFDCNASHRDVENYQTERKKFFEKRITKDSPKIIVFDEGAGGEIPSISLEKITIPKQGDSEGYLKNISGYTASMAVTNVSTGLESIIKDNSQIFGSKGQPSFPWNFKKGTNCPKGESRPTSRLFGLDKTSSSRGRTPDEYLISSQLLKDLVRKGEFTFAGRIVKQPEQKKRAMEWIEQLKKVGKEAGEELSTEMEKIKNSPK